MVNFTPASVVSDISYGLGLLASFGQQVDVVGIYANGGQNTVVQSGAPTSNILNSILGTTANTGAFGQMFTNARPVKATIRETSKIMEHPVETGVVLSDHHIINPVEIDLSLVVTSSNPGLIGQLIGGGTSTSYATTYSQIRQAFLNATPLTVKTRTGTYSDMIIAEMPHEEEADMYDVITIALRLKQVIYVVPGGGTLVNFQPANPLNGNTLASGLQQAASIGSSLLTAGTAVASYARLGKLF